MIRLDVTRIRTTASAAILILIAGLGGSPMTRADSDVEVRTVPVVDGIAMLIGEGGNLAVSYGEDGVLVVDDQYARMSKKLLAAIEALSSSPLHYVLNTHWHGDHTGGNADMAAAGATIVAHHNVRERMSKPHTNPFFGSTTPASPDEALPVITFGDDLTLHFNGTAIRAEHVDPAHTDGDAIIWFEGRNVVHMGDIYFNGIYPFIDATSGGDVAGMLAAVDRVLARVDVYTRIIPGHGPLSNEAELRVYREMLETLSERVAKLAREGRSVEEIIARKPTADYDAKWGGGFLKPDSFVRVLYSVVTAK